MVLIVLGAVGIFVSLYLINKKTKPPKDCPKNIVGCQGCMLNCNRREEDFNVSDYLNPDLTKVRYVKIEKVKKLKKEQYMQESDKLMREILSQYKK